MKRVEGKVAIVTGAAQGLGEATARMLAREGAKVVLTDLQSELGELVAQSIRAMGGLALFLHQDACSEADWRRVVDRAGEEYGGLHVLINNAGIGMPGGTAESLSLADWHRMIAINLDSVFLGTREGIAAMRRTGEGGSIVNLSSIHGLTGAPKTAAYAASKGGVRSFTKAAALHCARAGYGIRVNSVHPGYIRTPMLEGAMRGRGTLEVEERAAEAATPLGRIGEPDDIAYGILYLASDESRYVTGAELVIDGGYTAQ
ncbi:MAG: glucose 1-dehydrogenase [Proteobacteria bacterium]|nr:glucose 1-dehydrogenase [Pseudomonadota bacterium]